MFADRSHLGGSLGSEWLKPAAEGHLSSVEPLRWYLWHLILSSKMSSTQTSTHCGLPCLILDLRLRLFLSANLARMNTAPHSVKTSYYIDGGKDLKKEKENRQESRLYRKTNHFNSPHVCL